MKCAIELVQSFALETLCSYGCGSVALYRFKHYKEGWKYCCSTSYMHCPVYRAGQSMTRFGNKDRSEYGMFKLFIKNFEFGATKSCWLWRSKARGQRYGTFRWTERKIYLAHVASYIFFIGEIGFKGNRRLEVCHTCDNGFCVNPNHLWLGTHKDNMNDMIDKGRARFAHKGSSNGNSKLTWKIVGDIRDVYDKATYKYGLQSQLGRKYRVSAAMIRDIALRENWNS